MLEILSARVNIFDGNFEDHLRPILAQLWRITAYFGKLMRISATTLIGSTCGRSIPQEVKLCCETDASTACIHAQKQQAHAPLLFGKLRQITATNVRASVVVPLRQITAD